MSRFRRHRDFLGQPTSLAGRFFAKDSTQPEVAWTFTQMLGVDLTGQLN